MYYILFGSILYAFFLSTITKKSKLLSEILGIIILSFFTFIVGLRYGVGIDYFSYESSFHMNYNTFTYEPIYSFSMYFVKSIFDKFYYLTFIMIFITNIFIYLGLKKRNITGIYLILAIFIYLSNVGIVFINLMRQGVAVAIFFYASTYIKDRNLKKYIIFMLLGAGFHSSILLLLPMYFIKDIKFSKLNYLISVIVSYLFVYTRTSQTVINFFASHISIYSKYHNHKYLFNEDVNLLAFGVLLNVIFIFSLLLFVKNKDKSYGQEISYYLIGTLINILALSTFMFDRIGIYFFIFGIIAIPKMIESIKNKNVRLFFFVLAVLVATSFFTQSLFINPEALRLKYKSIFSLP